MAVPRTSLRAAYAKHMVNKHLLTKYNNAISEHHDTLPPAPQLPPQSADDSPYQGRVCIIGAGAAGLYTAMMLKFLGATNVDILEATDRVGGRCYTHHFSSSSEHHDYYDVGAMRIPDIPWMQQILKFIGYLGLESDKQEYVYKNKDAPCSYWYRNKPIVDDKFDKFMKDIVTNFMTNFDAAFDKWLKTDKDNWSTRAFLMAGPQNDGAPNPYYTYDETATAEIYDTSTGLFDQSFTETVIDYADFKAAEFKKWWRIDGGMQKLTDAMQKNLASTSWPFSGSKTVNVTFKSPVAALSDKGSKISVTVAGKPPVDYDMVFNTTPMGPFKEMDLQDVKLPDNILTGIRSLSYDRATKVAIKFSKPWWNQDPKKIYGGISTSDLPISNVVYPSWNDGPDKQAVLIVSYCWAQDATRIASLIPDYTRVTPSKNDQIVTLCLQNLVKLWSGQSHAPTFEELSKSYMTHHAWAWENDPWTGGAFALYGPGQFKNVYPQFQGLLCDHKLALCGEALSAHHAWISGALDSAYLQMNHFLTAQGRTSDLAKLKASIFGGGPGRHADEMDEELVKWTVLLGGGGPEGWGDELNLGKGKINGSK